MVAAITACELKVKAAVEAIAEQVRQTEARIHQRLEIDSYAILAAAQEIATAQGCAPVRTDDLAALKPRYSAVQLPTGPALVKPTYVMLQPADPVPPGAVPIPAIDGGTLTPRADLPPAMIPLAPPPPVGVGAPPPPVRIVPTGGQEKRDCTKPMVNSVYGPPICDNLGCKSPWRIGDQSIPKACPDPLGRPTMCFTTCSQAGYLEMWTTLNGEVIGRQPSSELCGVRCCPADDPTCGQSAPPPPPPPPPDCKTECNPTTGKLIKTCVNPGDAAILSETVVGDCTIAPPPPPDQCCPPQQITVEVPPPKPVDCKTPAGRDEPQCFDTPPEKDDPDPGSLQKINWDSPQACAQVDGWLDTASGGVATFLGGLVSEKFLRGEWDADRETLEMVHRYPPVIRWLPKAFFPPFLNALREVVKTTWRTDGCGDPALLFPMVGRAMLEIIQRWSGVSMQDSITQISYALNYKCPTEIPSPSELHRARLLGDIPDAQWECLIRANNLLPESARRIMESGRVKLNVADNIAAWRRGLWTDADLTKQLKSNGVIDGVDRAYLVELSKVIPPYGDLVRMMVRDSFDDAVAAKFGYDQEFTDKFAGQAKKWAKAQGIEDDVMRYLWRAHWRLPSATQAFEMLHRNRPGRVDAAIVVTPADVKQLLAIDDMAPFWQDRLINTSYAVPRLVDLRKNYNYGVFDSAELSELYQDRGYSKRDADRQAKATRIDKTMWLLGRPIVRRYVAQKSTRDEAMGQVLAWADDQAQADEVIGRADVERRDAQRAKCAAGVKKRYGYAEFGDADAVGLLLRLDYSLNEATEMVRGWACERASKGKEASANMLCGWVEQGLITAAEMLVRLVRMGWKDLDAARIVRSCQLRIRAKLDKLQQQVNKTKRDAKGKASAAPGTSAPGTSLAASPGTVPTLISPTDTSKDVMGAMLKIIKAGAKYADATGEDRKAVRKQLRDMACDLAKTKGYSAAGAAALVVEIAAEAASHDPPDLTDTYLDIRADLPDNPTDAGVCGGTMGPPAPSR